MRKLVCEGEGLGAMVLLATNAPLSSSRLTTSPRPDICPSYGPTTKQNWLGPGLSRRCRKAFTFFDTKSKPTFSVAPPPGGITVPGAKGKRSEEHTSELQSRGLISYAV